MKNKVEQLREDINRLRKLTEGPIRKTGPGDRLFDNVAYENDGWNEQWFEEIGLLPALEEAGRLAYEIKSSRRGAYALDDDSATTIADYINEICTSLQQVIDTLEYYQ